MKQVSSKIIDILKEVEEVFTRFHTISNSNKILKYFIETERKLLECIEIDNTALKVYFYYMELCLLTTEKILYNNEEYIEDKDQDAFKKAENYLHKAVDLFKQIKKLIGKYKADHPYYFSDAIIYSLYAKVLFHLNEKNEAIKYYEKAIQKNPDDLFSTNMIAVILMEEKKYNEAEQYLHKILKKDRYNYLALSNLGEIAKGKNEFRKAKMYYEEALRENSEDLFSKKQLEIIKDKVPKHPLYDIELIREEAFTNSYKAAIFYEHMDDKGVYLDKEETIHFYTQNIGNINVTTGNIIASDIYFFDNFDKYVFRKKFPKGAFPIELAIAQFKENTDERIAFMRIKFSEKTPAKWEIALFNEESLGYDIESACACLMDIAYKDKYASIMKDEKNKTKFLDQFNKQYKNTRGWALVNEKDLNVALFSTGYGDGVYQSYIGYDKDDKICRLVNDFEIIKNEDEL